MSSELPEHCLSVPGCRRPRLRYAGYCREHGHVPEPTPTRCQAPIRCYCPMCGQTRLMLGPPVGPEAARLMIDALRAQQGRPLVSLP